MLGSLGGDLVWPLLERVAAGDGKGAIAEAERIAGRSVSFDAALEELAALLHRVALAQAGAGPADDDADAQRVQRDRAARRRGPRAGHVPDRAPRPPRPAARAGRVRGLHDDAAADARRSCEPAMRRAAREPQRRARAAKRRAARRARDRARRRRAPTPAPTRRRAARDRLRRRLAGSRRAPGPHRHGRAWSRATASWRRSPTTTSSSSCPSRIACTRRRPYQDKLKAELRAALRRRTAPHGAAWARPRARASRRRARARASSARRARPRRSRTIPSCATWCATSAPRSSLIHPAADERPAIHEREEVSR